mmetsp:Transcript_43592/g.118414  ORF Transcript_43592/g.118414 Transcript_43592/m.118414 type:complete len:209 (-) Transcript_43592:369-995(-)
MVASWRRGVGGWCRSQVTSARSMACTKHNLELEGANQPRMACQMSDVTCQSMDPFAYEVWIMVAARALLREWRQQDPVVDLSQPLMEPVKIAETSVGHHLRPRERSITGPRVHSVLHIFGLQRTLLVLFFRVRVDMHLQTHVIPPTLSGPRPGPGPIPCLVLHCALTNPSARRMVIAARWRGRWLVECDVEVGKTLLSEEPSRLLMIR